MGAEDAAKRGSNAGVGVGVRSRACMGSGALVFSLIWGLMPHCPPLSMKMKHFNREFVVPTLSQSNTTADSCYVLMYICSTLQHLQSSICMEQVPTGLFSLPSLHPLLFSTYLLPLPARVKFCKLTSNDITPANIPLLFLEHICLGAFALAVSSAQISTRLTSFFP